MACDRDKTGEKVLAAGAGCERGAGALTASRRPGTIARMPRRPSRPHIAAALAVAAAAVTLVPGGSAATPRVKCPLDATSSASSRQVQWAFSQYGPPVGRHRGLTKSYTHGRGTWLGERAHGWVCHQDMGGGSPTRHVVLRTTATGSQLHGMVTRLGKLGVEIVLPLKVTATDDSACAVGTRATITLFASYYEFHITRGVLRFEAGCRRHDHTYRNPALKVLITRKGAQVNGP